MAFRHCRHVGSWILREKLPIPLSDNWVPLMFALFYGTSLFSLPSSFCVLSVRHSELQLCNDVKSFCDFYYSLLQRYCRFFRWEWLIRLYHVGQPSPRVRCWICWIFSHFRIWFSRPGFIRLGDWTNRLVKMECQIDSDSYKFNLWLLISIILWHSAVWDNVSF